MPYGEIAHIGKGTTLVGTSINDTVMQTRNNFITFMGRIDGVTTAYNTNIFSLPSYIDNPDHAVYFVAPYYEGSAWKVGIFGLTTAGNIRTYQALSNAQVLLNGLVISTNDNYYNSAIGNNDESYFTSPLSSS